MFRNHIFDMNVKTEFGIKKTTVVDMPQNLTNQTSITNNERDSLNSW